MVHRLFNPKGFNHPLNLMNRLHIWEFLHLPSASKMRKHEAIKTSRWLHINALNFQICSQLIWPWKIWNCVSGGSRHAFAPGARIHSASDSLLHAWACCTHHLLTLALCANELILDITWAAFSGAVWRSCVECAHFFFFFERVALSPNHDDIYGSHKSTPPLPWLGPASLLAFPWFVPR